MATKLVDNNLTKDEIIQRLKICLTTSDDAYQMGEILKRTFNLKSKEEALYQMISVHTLFRRSIKVVDKYTNEIYGLLILSDFPLHYGTPLMDYSKKLGELTMKFKQLNGFAFILDDRIKGCGIDKMVLSYFLNHTNFPKEYNLIWCGVENNLKSHEYWKRLGFKFLFENGEAKFYVKLLNLENLKK